LFNCTFVGTPRNSFDLLVCVEITHHLCPTGIYIYIYRERGGKQLAANINAWEMRRKVAPIGGFLIKKLSTASPVAKLPGADQVFTVFVCAFQCF